MAISENTAALVAAQLTAAWAARAGKRDPNPRLIFEDEVLNRFNHFYEKIAGKSAPSAFEVL